MEGFAAESSHYQGFKLQLAILKTWSKIAIQVTKEPRHPHHFLTIVLALTVPIERSDKLQLWKKGTDMRLTKPMMLTRV